MHIIDYFLPTNRNDFKAHFLKPKAIACFAILLLMTNLATSLFPQTNVLAEVDSDSLIYLHNKQRTQHNLNSLSVNSKLIDSAMLKADAMLKSDCWDHYCPNGTSPWKTFKDVGYEYMYAGENLAEGFSDNSILINAWMNSPTHRENILKEEFSEIGIGFAYGKYQGNNENTIAVVHFGHPLPLRAITQNPTSSGTTTIEDSSNIQIFQPENGRFFKEAPKRITGRSDINIKRVEVYLNNKLITTITPKDDLFQFALASDTFNQGENTIKVTGKNLEGEILAESKNHAFFIDQEAPIIDITQFTISEIKQDDGQIIIFKIPTSNDWEKAQLTLDENPIMGIEHNGNFIFEVSYQNLSSANKLNLRIEDKAANSTTTELPLSTINTEVYNQITKYNLDKSNTLNSILGINEPLFGFDMSTINWQTGLRLFLGSFMALLIIFEIIHLKRTNQFGSRLHGLHTKLAMVVVLIFITLITSGVGEILKGLNI